MNGRNEWAASRWRRGPRKWRTWPRRNLERAGDPASLRLATTPSGLDTAEVQSRLATYGPTRRRDRQAFAALAAVPRPLPQSAGHHPARGERAVRGDRRCRELFHRRDHRHDQHDARFCPGSPGPERGRGAAPVGGGPGDRAARWRNPLGADRPAGPRRHRRADRRRSDSRGFAAARKPRSVRQSGAPHRRAVPGREAGRRRGVWAPKTRPEHRTRSLPAPR